MDKKPEKKYYDVVIELVSPITVKYRVLSESPQEAAKMAESGKLPPTFISKPRIEKQRIKTLMVYLAGTVMKVFSK